MSTADTLFAAKDGGITQEQAKAANVELEHLRKSSLTSGPKHPLVFFEHGSNTRRASNEFLEVCTKI